MKTTTLRLVTTAMLLALATVIVQVIRILGLGAVSALISPMHLPIMLIGLLCGWQLGLLSGIILPLLSFAISGGTMPVFPTSLIPMLIELPLYGVVMGLSRRFTLHDGKTKLPLLLATVVSTIIIGRIGGAFTTATVYALLNMGAFWVVLPATLLNSAISSWVGIVIALVLVPTIAKVLQHSGILLKYLDTPKSDAPQDTPQDVTQDVTQDANTADQTAQ